MLSFEEYQKAIDTFMWEMQATCSAVTAEQLQQLPELISDLEEFKRALTELSINNEALIGLAFGLFDKFVHITKDKSIRDCYELYVDMHRGKSTRLPEK